MFVYVNDKKKNMVLTLLLLAVVMVMNVIVRGKVKTWVDHVPKSGINLAGIRSFTYRLESMKVPDAGYIIK